MVRKIKIKGLIEEDFINFRLPSMYIAFPKCNFKCDKENGGNFCQNSFLSKEADIEISKENLIERYLKNKITKAIVLGGLEPFDSELDLLPFIDTLRRQYNCDDIVVIYTGYTEEELINGKWGNGSPNTQKSYWENLIKYKNIIIKFGRYRPDQESHYDSILGVNLASINQYAKEYNCEN